jgi:MSHA pilin protein MshA
MKNQCGFTIVELILVIVILSILAVATVPLFINITTKSRVAMLEAVGGALQSASSLYSGYAELKGVKTGYITINGNSVQFNSSYPEGHWNNCWRYILNVTTAPQYTPKTAKCEDNALCGVGNQTTIPSVPGLSGGRGIIIWPKGYYISDDCFTYYYNPHNGNVPVTGVVDSGC